METRAWGVWGILAATLVASASQAADKTFDRRFTVAPGGQLTLNAETGSVTVSGHAGNEVVIHAQLSGSDAFLSGLKITTELTSSGVGITERKAGASGLNWFGTSGEKVHFAIDVPNDYSIELKTSGGDLEIRNVHGSVAMHTSGGNIDAAGLRGTTELGTSGGNVSVADSSGTVEAQTSGGDIDLRNVDARVNAETSGGNVIAVVSSNRGLSLSTSGGSISLPPLVRASIDAEPYREVGPLTPARRHQRRRRAGHPADLGRQHSYRPAELSLPLSCSSSRQA